MTVKTKSGSSLTITETGVLVEVPGHFGKRWSGEIPFSSIKKVEFASALLGKSWFIYRSEGLFWQLAANNENSNFVAELKRRTAPAPNNTNVSVVVQAPATQSVQTIQREVVKIRCAHCRTINEDGSPSCTHCGGRL